MLQLTHAVKLAAMLLITLLAAVFDQSVSLNCCRGTVSNSGFASYLGSESQTQGSIDRVSEDDITMESVPSTGLQAENEKLRKQLQQSQSVSQKWQQLHAELHSACVSKLLNTSN